MTRHKAVIVEGSLRYTGTGGWARKQHSLCVYALCFCVFRAVNKIKIQMSLQSCLSTEIDLDKEQEVF